MDMTKTLRVVNRHDWRAWLEQNHDRETEIWLIFYKAHTRQPGVSYEEAVEEALCFGWIDSIVKRIDDDRYAQKFTPRKAGSQWSVSNKRRVAKLIRESRMTPAGLAKVTYDDPSDPPVDEGTPELALAEELEAALIADEVAWAQFNRLAPSQRRNYVRWVMSARKDETRLRRLSEIIALLRQGKALGLK